MGILYIVSTPIGNMEDISLRALKILKTVDAIFCEDTRKTKNLLKLSEINKIVIPLLVSFYEKNEERRIPEAISLLREGKNIALVSNAGTPLISDPGYTLVKECIKQKIKIIPIPGASSILTALVASGFPTDKFIFLGFLPKKTSKKKKLLLLPKPMLKTTIVFFESPYRLLKTLNLIEELFYDAEVVIARELTKVYEEFFRGKISKAIKHFSKPKGEFVVMFRF